MTRFTDHKGESVGTFETNWWPTSTRIGTTSYRHYEVSIQSSNPTSFSSTNPSKTSFSANLLVQWKRVWHTGMKRRPRNTTTWRFESQKKDSQSASSLLKLAAEACLESHCACIGTSEEDYWRIILLSLVVADSASFFYDTKKLIKNLLKKLSLIAQWLHWNAPERPFINKFRTIMLIKGLESDFFVGKPVSPVLRKDLLSKETFIIIIGWLV